MKTHIALILYGILSIFEGVLNTFLYVSLLYKLPKVKVFDFAMPFYFWMMNNGKDV